MAEYDPTFAGPALRSEQGDGDEPVNADGLTEAETIDLAEHEILMAQYRALHDRLQDYTVWLVEMGFLAKNAIAGPNGTPSRTSDYEEFLFEHVEAYLDEANEHEDRGPLDQILHPNMDEETSEEPRPCPWSWCIVEGLNDPAEMRKHLEESHDGLMPV